MMSCGSELDDPIAIRIVKVRVSVRVSTSGIGARNTRSAQLRWRVGNNDEGLCVSSHFPDFPGLPDLPGRAAQRNAA